MSDERWSQENTTEVDSEFEEVESVPVDEDVEPVSGEEAGPVISSDIDAVPVTGLDSVDRVLAKEAAVRELPVQERAAAYQQLHDELEHILNRQPGSLPTELTGP